MRQMFYIFFQYGGNPVSCAIALAVMDVIEKEKLQDNALDVGNYWTSKIRNLKSQFPIIGDVRYDVINRYDVTV